SVLIELLSLFEPWRVRRDDERGLPAAAEVGVDRRNNDVHVGNSAVGGPGLHTVEHPLVVGFVVAGTGEDGAHIGARAGFRRTERPKQRVLWRAEHLRKPFAELFGCAVGSK